MKVRARTVLLLLITAGVVWAVLQSIGVVLGDRVSNQIDAQDVASDVGRAVAAINFDAEQLKHTTADWALWDDTYRYVRDRNAAYASTNLTDGALAALGVDFMVFTDKTGTTIHAKAVDPLTRHDVALPRGFSEYLASVLPRLHLTDPHKSVAGAANLPAGTLLLAVAPISSNTGSAPLDGYFVTGFFLSPDKVAALRHRTLLPLSLRPPGSSRPGIIALAGSSVSDSGNVPGIDGRPAVTVEVTHPRTAFTLTRGTVLSGGAALGILGLLLLGSAGLLLDTTVVLPDHLRAFASQMTLDIACESMDRLRNGLTPEAADKVCRRVLEHCGCASAVEITDTEHVLGFAGVGSEHHVPGRPLLTGSTRQTLKTGRRAILRGRRAVGCADVRCPLKAAIVVPLHLAGSAGGTLTFYFTSARKLNRTSIALADGLGRLLSMRLELDRSQGELAYLAAHDPSTGLANRRQFENELKRELAEEARLGGTGALLWFDLDHFKDINDCLGHAAGDEILVAFAEMLRESSRDYCTLARLGGDEFGMLVPHADEREALETASRLIRTLADTSFSVGGHEVRVSASIGLVRYPVHGEGCDQLMARADLAMYQAKATGGNRFVAYTQDDSWRSRMTEHIEIAERIVTALRENRFRLYAQPLRRLSDGSTAGYELLLRMIGEDGAIVMPSEIIPTAERLGVIRDIDRWVARRAISIMAAEQAAGRDTFFAINISGAAFSDPELLDIIRTEFRSQDVKPSNLVIEITETTAIADIERAQEFIRALKEIGCRFSLDDFGSGSSSFYYLKHLAVDFLKIDGGLIKGLGGDSPDAHFVRAIVEMCRGLNIETVAEYVESPYLLDAVIAHGVDFAQGYEVGRPYPLDTYLTAPGGRAHPAATRVIPLVPAPAENGSWV